MKKRNQYDKCFGCAYFETVESPLYDTKGNPDGIAPEPYCEINEQCLVDGKTKFFTPKNHVWKEDIEI